MWFRNLRTVVRLLEGVWLRYTADDGFLDGRVHSLARGVAVFGRPGRIEGVGRRLGFTKGSGRSYEASDGTVWFSARTGLYRFDPSAPSGQGWMRFTEADSLADTSVFDLGVLHFDGEFWNVLEKEDGLTDNKIRRIFRASDGAIWFLGITGLSRFDPMTREWTRSISAHGIRSFGAGYFVQNVTEASDGTFWKLPICKSRCRPNASRHLRSRFRPFTKKREPERLPKPAP